MGLHVRNIGYEDQCPTGKVIVSGSTQACFLCNGSHQKWKKVLNSGESQACSLEKAIHMMMVSAFPPASKPLKYHMTH